MFKRCSFKRTENYKDVSFETLLHYHVYFLFTNSDKKKSMNIYKSCFPLSMNALNTRVHHPRINRMYRKWLRQLKPRTLKWVKKCHLNEVPPPQPLKRWERGRGNTYLFSPLNRYRLQYTTFEKRLEDYTEWIKDIRLNKIPVNFSVHKEGMLKKKSYATSFFLLYMYVHVCTCTCTDKTMFLVSF